MARNQMITAGLVFFSLQSVANAAVMRMNTSSLQLRAGVGKGTSYGDNKCRCVGIDNMKGYYATEMNFYHVEFAAEAGASCGAWDNAKHPECTGAAPPQWCRQEWCYVDPCSCDLDVLPKQSTAGVTYQGAPAYWSYKTCGGMDFFSQDQAKGSCVMQKSEGACAKNGDCAWDATRNQCGGKEVVKTCAENTQKDATVHGAEDCRCVGLSGRDVGKAFMYINDKDLIPYSANVGGSCGAWEQENHPDCQPGAANPDWCGAKWCFVDPCKCKTAVTPSAVMPANRFMRFQGKTAYWSYDTCGSKDSWSTAHSGKYCKSFSTEGECEALEKCAWNGKQCLGKALVEICAKQEATGVLGVESPLSGTTSLAPFKALLVILAFGMQLVQ